MARTVIEQISDDLDGSANAESVSFAFDGTEYTVDLSNKNKNALAKALKPYIEAGSKVKGSRSSGRKSSGRSSSRGDLDQVREWASANGHKVSSRGRIAQSVLDAYDAR